jgi:N-terminal acetyltransferase 2
MFYRFHFFRTIVPRVSRPILPLASSGEVTTTRTLTGGAPRISPFRSIHHATPARLSSSPSNSSSPDAAKDSPSTLGGGGGLSERLKILMKKYGWYAVGVYFAISVVDFAVAFAGINLLGADYVSSLAASAKAWVLGLVYSRPPEPGREEMEDVSGNVSRRGQEGLYAMLVLAYTVHKTLFLPVRIGFTAAFTPRIVNWLRARGWAGGDGTRRAMNEMKERLRNRD